MRLDLSQKKPRTYRSKAGSISMGIDFERFPSLHEQPALGQVHIADRAYYLSKLLAMLTTLCASTSWNCWDVASLAGYN